MEKVLAQDPSDRVVVMFFLYIGSTQVDGPFFDYCRALNACGKFAKPDLVRIDGPNFADLQVNHAPFEG